MFDRSYVASIGLAMALCSCSALAQDQAERILIRNVHIFDGKSESLIAGRDVLIEGRLIKQIGPGLSAGGATVIDGGGRTLMPGLIDCHSHLNINGAHGLGSTEAEQTWQDIATIAVAKARVFLEEGFTTVRDMGGMAAGLQRQIASIPAERSSARPADTVTSAATRCPRPRASVRRNVWASPTSSTAPPT